MSSETKPRSEGVRFVVRGRVQGVGFRWWTERQAQQLGLTGTVRNRADGTVEAHVFGPADRIDRFGALLRQGPPSSEVTEVEASTLEVGGDTPTRFQII